MLININSVGLEEHESENDNIYNEKTTDFLIFHNFGNSSNKMF